METYTQMNMEYVHVTIVNAKELTQKKKIMALTFLMKMRLSITNGV